MLEVDIPGFGLVKLRHLVSDFTGTLSVDGKLGPGVKETLNKIAEFLKIHILTADTFGRAKKELEGVFCETHIITGKDHDVQKELYIKKLGAESVVATGNGINDRKMLKAAKIGIAVCLKEGCAKDAYVSSDIIVASALDALELLLNTKRLKATLRF
ncbi:MAG: ATPase P [Nitrospirae bacterium]|jgi:P-type E1-E2 ATPase|nr:ATPase P [Nitrospirota bacterium]